MDECWGCLGIFLTVIPPSLCISSTFPVIPPSLCISSTFPVISPSFWISSVSPVSPWQSHLIMMQLYIHFAEGSSSQPSKRCPFSPSQPLRCTLREQFRREAKFGCGHAFHPSKRQGLVGPCSLLTYPSFYSSFSNVLTLPSIWGYQVLREQQIELWSPAQLGRRNPRGHGQLGPVDEGRCSRRRASGMERCKFQTCANVLSQPSVSTLLLRSGLLEPCWPP